MIIEGVDEEKNSLLNLINNWPHIYNIYLYANDLFETKYQLLINKHERVGLKDFDDPKIVLECSDYMEDVYEILMDKTQISKRKILIVSDDLIVNMVTNEKLNPTVT